MTKLLERAFAEASKLSREEQDALADCLLREMESEDRWTRSFAGSQNALAKLAADALKEHRAGNTQALDPTPSSLDSQRLHLR